MSLKAMSWVWEHSDSKGAARLALLALADGCNDDGYCYHGQQRIAKKVGVSKRSLQRVLDKLIESGDLIVHTHKGIKTGSGRTNLYVLAQYRQDNQMPHDLTDSEFPFQEATKVSPQEATKVSPQEATKVSHKPSVEPSVEPKNITPAVEDEKSEPPKYDHSALLKEVETTFGVRGGRANNLVCMLRGTSKKGVWAEHKLDDPMDAEELAEFRRWYARKYPTRTEPLGKAETIQSYILLYREECNKQRRKEAAVMTLAAVTPPDDHLDALTRWMPKTEERHDAA